tara:strand:+ start:26902 stop:27678 length:777 start_codon:yes stop_codon:yes gene_type:complete
LCLCCFRIAFSQSEDIKGRVKSTLDAENIHVINKTSQTFTITDKTGAFTIQAKLNDTLLFSSIQHQLKTLVVNKEVIAFKTLFITLEAQINELDEVVVGKVLTGNLLLDIGNAETDTPINFYDVGIPGYKGKIATQSERRFDQANGDGLNYKTLILQVLTANVAIDPIVNGISGRTKMLRSHVVIENNANLLRQIRVKFAEDFFKVNPLDETLQMDFFYFCEEDKNFSNRCKGKGDVEIWAFLKEKYVAYKKNLSINE